MSYTNCTIRCHTPNSVLFFQDLINLKLGRHFVNSAFCYYRIFFIMFQLYLQPRSTYLFIVYIYRFFFIFRSWHEGFKSGNTNYSLLAKIYWIYHFWSGNVGASIAEKNDLWASYVSQKLSLYKFRPQLLFHREFVKLLNAVLE